MKYPNSVKGAVKRHPASKRVLRNGVICIINEREPRFKARQGKKRMPKG